MAKSQNNHLMGVWMPVSFIAQRGGGDKEVKRRKFCKYHLEWPALGRGCVNFCFLVAIHRTGSRCFPEQRHFGLTFRQRRRVPWGRPLCIDSILFVNKSSGKQRLK